LLNKKMQMGLDLLILKGDLGRARLRMDLTSLS
jgi:hypothetical protein